MSNPAEAPKAGLIKAGSVSGAGGVRGSKAADSGHTAILMSTVDLQMILDDLKADPLSLANFRAFCKEEFSEENLDFWTAASHYAKSSHLSANELAGCAKHIWKRWAMQGAKEEINLSSGVRAATLAELKKAFPNWDSVEPVKTLDFSFSVSSPLMQNEDGLEMVNKQKHESDTNPDTLPLRSVYSIALQEIYKLTAKDTFPRFIKKVTLHQHLDLAKDLVLWWRQKPGVVTFENFFTFPNPVNDADSRMHNMLSVFLCLLAILLDEVFGFYWLYFYIFYGFTSRVFAGPRLDPSAWFLLFVMHPIIVGKLHWLEDKFKAGPPSRFTQGMCMTFALIGIVLRFPPFELVVWSHIVFAGIAAAAGLAGITGWCAGCWCFSILMQLHLVPQSVIHQCSVQYV